MLIFEALGKRPPRYAHIPLILAPDRSKLSKRHGAVSVTEYADAGYLPEAMINFIAMLGWSPQGAGGEESEIFAMEDLVAKFDIRKIQKGGARFDIEKLKWLNREYLKRLTEEEFVVRSIPFVPPEIKSLPDFSEEKLRAIRTVLLDRIHALGDIKMLVETGEIQYFFAPPSYPPELLLGGGRRYNETLQGAQRHLKEIIHLLEPLPKDDFTQMSVKNAVWGYAEEKGRGAVLWPFRMALTGKEKSPDPFTVAGILGKEETLRRLHHALSL
jgi:glutamyl/glutaminyl-tRNA synthetase